MTKRRIRNSLLSDLSVQERQRIVECLVSTATNPATSAKERIAAVRAIIAADWLNLTAATVSQFEGRDASELLRALRRLATRAF